MCKNDDEVERQYAEAADDRRPFVAMVEGGGESGRKVVYDMSSTGEGPDGYILSDDAVEELDGYRKQVERDDDHELRAGECTLMEGSFTGLTIDGAQEVATRVVVIVWDGDNWEDRTA